MWCAAAWIRLAGVGVGVIGGRGLVGRFRGGVGGVLGSADRARRASGLLVVGEVAGAGGQAAGSARMRLSAAM